MSASATFFSVDGGADMGGMTTRSRRTQDSSRQPNYDIPPPPSGVSPVKQPGSRSGATNGDTRTLSCVSAVVLSCTLPAFLGWPHWQVHFVRLSTG